MDAKYRQIDLNGAIDRLEVSIENLNKLISNFFKRDILELIKKDFKENNHEQIHLHVHSLKGSSGSLGLTGLSLYAAGLEKQIINGEALTTESLDDLTTLWNELSADFT